MHPTNRLLNLTFAARLPPLVERATLDALLEAERSLHERGEFGLAVYFVPPRGVSRPHRFPKHPGSAFVRDLIARELRPNDFVVAALLGRADDSGGALLVLHVEAVHRRPVSFVARVKGRALDLPIWGSNPERYIVVAAMN